MAMGQLQKGRRWECKKRENERDASNQGEVGQENAKGKEEKAMCMARGKKKKKKKKKKR